MKIEIGCWGNCSEAVFRFYTLDPEKMRIILQAIVDEVDSHYTHEQKQIIPKCATPECFATTGLMACAGLGDPNAVITIEPDKEAFRLNIGNNDLGDETDWIEKILNLGIKVEEAEKCEELMQHARDCCCGIVFFPELSPTGGRKE